MSRDASFGQLIRRLRRAADLTQRDLAQLVGYSVVTIRKVESDERRPSRDLAERLLAHLYVSAAERTEFLALAREQFSAPTNLATPLTRIIGRDTEIETVCDLLSRGENRLVTLVGPPGIGKTRLSIQVASQLTRAFPHGIFCVELAPMSDSVLVIPTIAKIFGVKESASQPLIDCLIDYLRPRRTLLILDNVEHMMDIASDIARILLACPLLKVLTTSRQPLHIRGERLYSVPALALPQPDHIVTAELAVQYPAIELFIERAKDSDPDFDITDTNATDIAAICANLEGIPLAIELVAARVRLLPPHSLLSRLDSRLTLLTGGPVDLPTRQRTLRGTIDWSYQLLDVDEQKLFARLSVFIGGCRLEAAEVVAEGDGGLETPIIDGLEALADKNLVRQEKRVDGQCYSVFFETIREFALERLAECGEERAIRNCYAAYYLQLAEQASQRLTGRHQEMWFDRLEAEHNNFRSAIEFYLHKGESGPGLRLVAALWRFWHVRSHQTEGGRWITLALALDSQGGTIHRAQALNGAGWIAHDQGDTALALSSFEESLRLSKSVGDRKGIAEALHGVGVQVQAGGDHHRALTCYSESLELYRALDDREGIAWSLDHLGYAALYFGEFHKALSFFDESVQIFQSLSHTWGMAILSHHQGLTLMALGDHDQSLERLSEGLAYFEDLGNSRGVAQSLYHLGHLAVRVSDLSVAESHFRQSLSLGQMEKDRPGMILALAGLGSVAVARGKWERAAYLYGAVEAFIEANVLLQTPLESDIRSRDVSVIQARLDKDEILAAWVSGRSMTLDQVATRAMK